MGLGFLLAASALKRRFTVIRWRLNLSSGLKRAGWALRVGFPSGSTFFRVYTRFPSSRYTWRCIFHTNRVGQKYAYIFYAYVWIYSITMLLWVLFKPISHQNKRNAGKKKKVQFTSNLSQGTYPLNKPFRTSVPVLLIKRKKSTFFLFSFSI